jgi:hypothetical protein
VTLRIQNDCVLIKHFIQIAGAGDTFSRMQEALEIRGQLHNIERRAWLRHHRGPEQMLMSRHQWDYLPALLNHCPSLISRSLSLRCIRRA